MYVVNHNGVGNTKNTTALYNNLNTVVHCYFKQKLNEYFYLLLGLLADPPATLSA